MDYMQYLPLQSDMLSLEEMELQFKICDLLYHYVDSFTEDEMNKYLIMQRKTEISSSIMKKLSNEKFKRKTCKNCGRPLPFAHKYGMCQKFHDDMYPGYNRYGLDDDWLSILKELI